MEGTSTASQSLPPFRNERHLDFSVPANRRSMEEALARVRSQLGSEYPIRLGTARVTTGKLLHSLNPSRPSEVVGVHHSAERPLAARAIEEAWENFPAWSRTSAESRVEMLLRAASLLRLRRLEFNAWLVFEAGKTWPEAEAETCEAIDFCEYYSRLMLKLAHPDPIPQAEGERCWIRYLPLGVCVVIPPWNFPLAILAGMTVAALVTGNTVVVKPSSDTPTVAAKFGEVLLEAGFPPESFTILPGSGGEIGDLLVEHTKTRMVAFTGSKDVGLRIQELASKPRPGQIWIKRVIAEMGGKDAIIVDDDVDLDAAVQGVLVSAFGYQGQKCSACSRAIVTAGVYEPFLDLLTGATARIRVGPADDPSYFMGPVINARARDNILTYIEIGKQEGELIAGGGTAAGEGYFVQPTIFRGVERGARIFREEIFGPVLAVTRARDFEHALELANDSEYGLTGSVYTRSREKIREAADRFHVGNLYFNRKCTGALVGCHPFGGFQLSGTDSKAGGPDYLLLFTQMKALAEKLA